MQTSINHNTTFMTKASDLRRRFLVMHFCKLKTPFDLLR